MELQQIDLSFSDLLTFYGYLERSDEDRKVSMLSFAKLLASFIELGQQSAPGSRCGQQAERAMLNMAAHRRFCQTASNLDLGSLYNRSRGAVPALDTYYSP